MLQLMKVSGLEPISKGFPVFTPNKILGLGRAFVLDSRINFPNSPIS